MNSCESLVLVDAYSQIFRSFYAIRMLTNSKGEPVNAAFVFTKLLLQLEKNHPSRYGAMLFDSGKVAFRLKLNPEYKANRPPMPDALKQQIPLIKEIASAFGWKLLQCEGYEADDLIGGFALKYNTMPVEIVSSDKDLSQLIDDRVTMLIPGTSGFDRRGRDEVVKKFGVVPELMIDFLALLGDSSDNIPGVPGVGPKGAAEILKNFGAAELWLNDPEKLDKENKFVKKLLPELEKVRCNRELIRLKTELPEAMAKEFPPCRKEPDWGKIREICRKNQFKSILKELPEISEVDTEKENFSADQDDLFAFSSQISAQKKASSSADDSGEMVQGELF